MSASSALRSAPSRSPLLAYLLNTVGIVVAACALFWFQPALLSAPFDGVFTYLNMVHTAQWQAPGVPIGGYYPLEGMGSRLMPTVPALLPHTSSVWLTDDPVLRVSLTYLMLTAMLASSMPAYYRAAGVSWPVALTATWLQVILAVTLSDLARAAWSVLSGQAGMVVLLAIFLQIGRGGRARSGWWLGAFVLGTVLFLLSDHVFHGYLAGPPLALAMLVHLAVACSSAERWWKLGALGGAGVAVLALGIPSWMLALTASISRTVFFDELIAQPQHAYTAGFVFRSTDAFTLVYVLAIVGIVGEAASKDRRRRALAAIPALLLAILTVAGAVWLLTDLKWRAPAPVFFNVFTFPWLALLAVRGLHHARVWLPSLWPPGRTTRAAARWRRPALLATAIVTALLGLKLAFGTATPTTLALVGLVLVLAQLPRARRIPHRVAVTAVSATALLAVAFNGSMIGVGRLLAGEFREAHSVQQLFAVSPPFTRLLRDRIGLTPGSQFQGYAEYLVPERKVPLTVPLEVLSWHARDIPTLSQYTYYLTPAYHAFVTRLLGHPEDRPNVNHVAIAKIDLRLMRMLGLRYLMVRDPAELPMLSRVDRQGPYRLYELDDPNLGSYSPTRVRRLPDARATLARLADPTFDPRLDVAVSTDTLVPDDLVPASASSLTFVRGGFRFAGRSAGRSLVVLPIQYTRCLELRTARGGGVEPRAFRVNLVETGLLFTGAVDVEGQVHFGGPWDRCLHDDVSEVERLGLRDLVEPRRVPEYSFPGPRLRLFGRE